MLVCVGTLVRTYTNLAGRTTQCFEVVLVHTFEFSDSHVNMPYEISRHYPSHKTFYGPPHEGGKRNI